MRFPISVPSPNVALIGNQADTSLHECMGEQDHCMVPSLHSESYRRSHKDLCMCIRLRIVLEIRCNFKLIFSLFYVIILCVITTYLFSRCLSWAVFLDSLLLADPTICHLHIGGSLQCHHAFALQWHM